MASFFQFSKTERTGIIVLLLLSIPLFYSNRIFSWFYHFNPVPVNTAWLQNVQDTTDLTLAAETAKPGAPWKGPNLSFAAHWMLHRPSGAGTTPPDSTLSPFVPDTAGIVTWERAGMPAWLAARTVKAIAHGYRFRSPEQLHQFGGISDSLAVQLLPKLIFVADSTGKHTVAGPPLELNTADSVALRKISGIGAYLAHAIIHYRQALGGYYSADQLMSVPGMHPENYARIHPHVWADSSLLIRINLNTAGETELERLYRVYGKQAKAILAWREAHGGFHQLSALCDIEVFDEATCRLLQHYCTL